MLRLPSLIGAGALVAVLASVLLLGSSNVATACACGGLLSSDPSLRVADEVALVTGDGSTETVVMRLNLTTTADNAALVAPTPAPATVTAAPADLFDDLAGLGAENRDGPALDDRLGTLVGVGGHDGRCDGGGPTVLRQVQLGPLEATTLSGGDLAGVQKWLQDNGYQLRPEISDGLEPYLREGWSVVAMRLNTGTPVESLNGPLAPVTLNFAADELMYPMRMSAQAKSPQTVVTYTLGVAPDAAHRPGLRRPRPSRSTTPAPIAGRTDNATLTRLAGEPGSGDYLTKMTTTIIDPAAITSDFRFAPAPTDEPLQRVSYRYEYTDVTLLLLGGAVVLFMAAVVVIVLIRRARRRTTAP